MKYRIIAETVEDQIRSHVYDPGEKIPSIRHLCHIHRVSPGCVIQALSLLEAKGLLHSRPKSGFFVANRGNLDIPRPSPTQQYLTEPQIVGVSNIVAEIMREANNPLIAPLGAALPDPRLLPTDHFSRLMAATVRNDHLMLGRYELASGHPELVRQLRQRLDMIGCPVSSEEITVTCGATEALNLAIRAVTRPGDIIAVESPCYFGLLQMLESLGVKALMISGSCEGGIDLIKLREALEKYPVKALALIPSFNNPSGGCLSRQKREQLSNVLTDYGVPLIEDDIYGDIHFDEERPRPVKAWDRTNLFLYCGSFSKMLAPGLRVGWVVGGRYSERVKRLKWISTLNTPQANQITIAKYLATGNLNRHLRRLRTAFEFQTSAMTNLIMKHFPDGTAISQPRGGMFLWVQLPSGVDVMELYRKALKEGIVFIPGNVFSPVSRQSSHLRISCGSPVDEISQAAIMRLGDLIRSMMKRGKYALIQKNRTKLRSETSKKNLFF